MLIVTVVAEFLEAEVYGQATISRRAGYQSLENAQYVAKRPIQRCDPALCLDEPQACLHHTGNNSYSVRLNGSQAICAAKNCQIYGCVGRDAQKVHDCLLRLLTINLLFPIIVEG